MEYHTQHKFSLLEKYIFENIYSLYQKQLMQQDSCDFNDLIFYVVKLMNLEKEPAPTILQELRNQYKYVLIDEVQDLNLMQQNWLRWIVGQNKNLTCVGDDDQIIYGYRGSNGQLIKDFETIFTNAKTIRLEQNFRSSKSIIQAANQLISNNHLVRQAKVLWTNNPQGTDVKIQKYQNMQTEISEICKIINSQITNSAQGSANIAVLTRKNSQLLGFQQALYYQGPQLRFHNKQYEEAFILEIRDYTLKGFNDKLVNTLKEDRDNGAIIFDVCNQIVQGEKSGLIAQNNKNSNISGNMRDIMIITDTQSDVEEIDFQKFRSSTLQIKTCLNVAQKSSLKKLLEKRERYKDFKRQKCYGKFLAFSGFDEYLIEYCNIRQKKLNKARENVKQLLNMIESQPDFKSFIVLFEEKIKSLRSRVSLINLMNQSKKLLSREGWVLSVQLELDKMFKQVIMYKRKNME
eukprot:403361861